MSTLASMIWLIVSLIIFVVSISVWSHNRRKRGK